MHDEGFYQTVMPGDPNHFTFIGVDNVNKVKANPDELPKILEEIYGKMLKDAGIK